MNADPHAGQPVLATGPDIEDADAILIMLHGRGAGAEDMLGLYDALGLDNVAALAPQAAARTWYPQSFLASLEDNQPYLDSALRLIGALVDDLIGAGIPSHKIALLGFSQGACLTCEFIARYPRRYGAAMGLTGGLIGPPGTPREYRGGLDGTPVFLGTSDPDMHVPVARVEETRDVLSAMGAAVELRLYPGMPHTVNEEELQICRGMLQAISEMKGESQ
jgi:predicted esterase